MRWDIDPSEINKRIAEYKPRNINDDTWMVVSTVAVDCVTRVKLESVHEAMDLIGAVSYFFAYVTQLGHAGPELPKSLTPQLRDRWLATTGTAEGTKRTRRSQITKVGRAVNPRAGWEYKGTRVSRKEVPATYNDDQLDELIDVITSHPSEPIRRIGRIVVSLGVGAGRDSRQIADVAAGNIERSGDEMTLVTQNRVRISIEQRYAKLLHPCLDTDGPLVGHWAQIDNYISEIVGHAGHRLQVGRCRSTWIVNQINNDVGPRQLVAALGVKDFGAIGKYVYLADQIRPDELVIGAVRTRRTQG